MKLHCHLLKTLVALALFMMLTSMSFAWLWTPGPNNDAKYIDELQRQKSEKHPDNALIHYLLAFRLMPSQGDDYDTSRANDIYENGWKDPKGHIKKWLETCEPMFEKIREGAAVEYAQGVGYDNDYISFHSVAVMHANDLLGTNGRCLEHQGRYREALAEYTVLLKMGGDFCSRGVDENARQVGVLVQSSAIEAIHRLITSGNLAATDIKDISQFLGKIENIYPPYAEFYRSFQEGRNCFTEDKVQEDIRQNEEMLREHSGLGGEELESQIQAYSTYIRDDAQVQMQLHEFRYQSLSKPWWERNFADIEQQQKKIINESPPIPNGRKMPQMPGQDILLQSFMGHEVDELLMLSHLRETRIAAALGVYFDGESTYPDGLHFLVPEYLRVLPIDPFSGESFRYEVAEDGKSYRLWSIGPDGRDDNGLVLHDPRRPSERSSEIWTSENSDEKFKEEEQYIHDNCVLTAGKNSPGDVFLPIRQ